MSNDKDAPIAIIGAGCWGLSTAHHLCKQGYTDITIFDKAMQVPSPYSAANDLNKIVRAQYDNDFYTSLGLVSVQTQEVVTILKLVKEAIEAWKTEDWSPYFHQTGHLVTVSGHAPGKAQKHFDKAQQYAQTHEALTRGVTVLDTPENMREYCWQLTGPLTGFRGYYNRLEGYAHSAESLKGIALKLSGLGVTFRLGPMNGHVDELVFNEAKTATTARRCIGLQTHNRAIHRFNTVICALGAYGASLVPQLGKFNVARCWSVAHVQLTPQECDILRGIPVVNSLDLGFFFEPDPVTRLLKITPLGAGYSNFSGTAINKVSLPPLDGDQRSQGSDAPIVALNDYIPLEDEMKMRRLLRETLPWLENRPFVEKKMCWFSDTEDSEYCIDFVPETENSLVVLSGDSGHGFKMMPIFGEWVCELLQRREQKLPRWRWRARENRGDDVTSGGTDWGNSVSWRFGDTAEVSDIIQEKDRTVKARLKL